MERMPYPSLLAIFVFLVTLGSEGRATETINWQRRNLSPSGKSLAISYGNNLLMAVGESGVIFTSRDGSTWTSRDSGTKALLSDIAYGRSTFVAVGAEGTVSTSPNGITWTLRDSGTVLDLYGVAYGDNTFVAVGDGGAILTCSNGVAWARRDSGTQEVLKKVARGGDTFVAVGSYGTIVTSASGADWRVQAANTSAHLEGIAYGNGTFVAVGGIILTSPDGVAWKESGPRTNHRFLGVAYGSGTFVAITEDGVIFTSPDGSAWTLRDSGLPLLAVAYGEGSFFVTAENGALLESQPLPSPQITVSPTFLDFGSTNVGFSSFKNLTISNSGSGNLIINRLTISGPNVTDFITQNDECTGKSLPAFQHCSVNIVFSPHALGSKSATLSIGSNDPATPTKAVSLTGSSSGVSPSSSGSFCFISWALDGSGLEEFINIFRRFRDTFLLESRAGRMVVQTYYSVSPPQAHSLVPDDWVRRVTRWGLMPLVVFAYFALHTSPGEKIFLLAWMMIGMLSAWRILRRYVPGGSSSRNRHL